MCACVKGSVYGVCVCACVGGSVMVCVSACVEGSVYGVCVCMCRRECVWCVCVHV